MRRHLTRHRAITVAVALAAASLAFPHRADAQVYAGPLGDQEYLSFLGSGDAIPGTFGVYVGPYAGSFAGDPTGQQFSLYCLDFDHYAKSQSVNVSGLATSDLSATRLGAGSYPSYQQTAYLSSLFSSWETAAADVGFAGQSKKKVWSALHAAIWTIVRDYTGGDPVPEAAGTWAMRDAFVSHAGASAGAFGTDGWYVLTATDKDDPESGQEFLIRTDTVPEPSTYVLLATGLLLLVGFGRRRLRTLGEG